MAMSWKFRDNKSEDPLKNWIFMSKESENPVIKLIFRNREYENPPLALKINLMSNMSRVFQFQGKQRKINSNFSLEGMVAGTRGVLLQDRIISTRGVLLQYRIISRKRG